MELMKGGDIMEEYTRYKIYVSYFDYRNVPSEDIYSGLTYDEALDKMLELKLLIQKNVINGYICKQYTESVYMKAGDFNHVNYPKRRQK